MPLRAWHTRILLATTLLCSSGSAAFARDLLEVWQLALSRDPIYAASGYSRDADQERLPQARAKLLPYVTAGANASVDNTRRARTLSDSATDRRAAWSLSLVQPLFDLPAWRTVQRADFQVSQADVTYRLAYQDLILRTAQAYFDVLAVQDSLRAVMSEKAAIETQLKAAQQGYELGATTITDAHEAQARLDLATANEINLRNELQLAEDALARLIAERPGDLAELPLTAALPAPIPNRIDEWTSQASHAGLSVKNAELQARIAEKEIEIARGQHAPTVDIVASTGSASDYGVDGYRSGSRSLDSTVGLQLSIPIFTGGEISSRVREQTSRLQQARAELENARREAVQLAQLHFKGVISGLSQIKALEAAARSSQLALEANRTGYEIGVRVNIDVLNAEQQVYVTQRTLARARYDTLMHGLRLKAAAGILEEADLVAINSLLMRPEAAAAAAAAAPPGPSTGARTHAGSVTTGVGAAAPSRATGR